MNKIKNLQFSSDLPVEPQDVWAYHEAPGAFGRLTPPPIFFQVLSDQRSSLTEGRLSFRLWFGPVPVRWVAFHEPGPTEYSFTDRMETGPVDVWVHDHIFEASSCGTRLTDRIQIVYPGGLRGLVARLFFGKPALKTLFWYRHWRTRRDLRALQPESGSTAEII